MIFLIEIICLLQLSNTPMIFFKGSYHILNGRGNLCKHDFGFKFFVRSLFTRQPCKQLPSRGVFKNQVNSRNSFNNFIQPKNRLLDSLRMIISSMLFNFPIRKPRLSYDYTLYYSSFWLINVLFVCLLFPPLDEDLCRHYIMCLLFHKVIWFRFLLYNRRRSHC